MIQIQSSIQFCIVSRYEPCEKLLKTSLPVQRYMYSHVKRKTIWIEKKHYLSLWYVEWKISEITVYYGDVCDGIWYFMYIYAIAR